MVKETHVFLEARGIRDLTRPAGGTLVTLHLCSESRMGNACYPLALMGPLTTTVTPVW